MRNRFRLVSALVLAAATVFVLDAGCRARPEVVPFEPQRGLDAFVPVPTDNPFTRERVELGRRLFFDPLLSGDGSVSCASCHRPEYAFADTVPLSRGAHGRRTRRNTPSLLNVAYAPTLLWDGRAPVLEAQVLLPVQDPLEMDLPLDSLMARLRARAEYARAFAAAFGRSEPRADDVARALAAFVRSLSAGDAPLDRFRGGDTTAFSAEARRGFDLFIGKADCSACHLGPLLTDHRFHNTGVSWKHGTYADSGRGAITGRLADVGAFRTPSLREAARTAPYMHDGSIATLDDVVEFYDRGGIPNPQLSRDIRPLQLTPAEKRDLIAFLRILQSR